jgi:hypothetical protein
LRAGSSPSSPVPIQQDEATASNPTRLDLDFEKQLEGATLEARASASSTR